MPTKKEILQQLRGALAADNRPAFEKHFACIKSDDFFWMLLVSFDEQPNLLTLLLYEANVAYLQSLIEEYPTQMIAVINRELTDVGPNARKTPIHFACEAASVDVITCILPLSKRKSLEAKVTVNGILRLEDLLFANDLLDGAAIERLLVSLLNRYHRKKILGKQRLAYVVMSGVVNRYYSVLTFPGAHGYDNVLLSCLHSRIGGLQLGSVVAAVAGAAAGLDKLELPDTFFEQTGLSVAQIICLLGDKPIVDFFIDYLSASAILGEKILNETRELTLENFLDINPALNADERKALKELLGNRLQSLLKKSFHNGPRNLPLMSQLLECYRQRVLVLSNTDIRESTMQLEQQLLKGLETEIIDCCQQGRLDMAIWKLESNKIDTDAALLAVALALAKGLSAPRYAPDPESKRSLMLSLLAKVRNFAQSAKVQSVAESSGLCLDHKTVEDLVTEHSSSGSSNTIVRSFTLSSSADS